MIDCISSNTNDVIIGGWMGFRSVHPYHSLLNQLNRLDDGQKRVLTDDIRRLVGSSTVENLLKYVRKVILLGKSLFMM